MNVKYKEFMTNLSYTLTSNIVSMIISMLVVVIVPKVIGVSEYGYWQLYIFYTSYLGFFHFGWVDGIYLRYGGAEYHNLNRNLFASQFWSFISYIIFAGGIILFYSFWGVSDSNKQFIFQMVAACLILSLPRGFLLYVMESTNRLKQYSILTILDRIIYCMIMIIMIMCGMRKFQYLVLADLIGKFITQILAIYTCKEIVFSKFIPIKENIKEIATNISVGIKLMFANIASMLIIGVVRFGIERSWDVNTFGKVSLTISIANFMMLFINAVGIIMFPILRRTNEKKLPGIYETMRNFLMIILFSALIIYYPVKVVLSAWLPQYADSLKYMALLFPMCVFEGQIALLVNTYLKTLRKEVMMLKINIVSLILSVITTSITTILLRNLDLAVASIVLVLAFRCIFAELYLSKILKISLYKDIILEVLMTIAFILSGWYINSWIALLLYAVTYCVYLTIKRKDLINTTQKIKMLIKS